MLEEMKSEIKGMNLTELRAAVANGDDGPATRWLRTIARGIAEDSAGHWRWIRSTITIPIPVGFRALFGGRQRTTQPKRALWAAINNQADREVTATCGDRGCIRPSHAASRGPLHFKLAGAISESASPARAAELTASLLRIAAELSRYGADPTKLLNQKMGALIDRD